MQLKLLRVLKGNEKFHGTLTITQLQSDGEIYIKIKLYKTGG